MDLSGNMTRQVELDLPVESDSSHISNVGKMVEDMEFKLKNLLRKFTVETASIVGVLNESITEEVYFGKTKDVVGDLRSESTVPEACRA